MTKQGYKIRDVKWWREDLTSKCAFLRWLRKG
jgi:hypothetical protein